MCEITHYILYFCKSRKFQIRIARSTIEGRLTDQEVNNTEQGRVALGTLKSQGQRIPVNRNGQALIGPAGRFHQDFASKENGGPAFSILKVSLLKLG